MIVALGGMLALLPTPISSQSVFGHPWASSRGVDDFYGHGYRHHQPGFGNHGFGDWHDDDYDDYFHRPAPCPRYQSMHVSDWKVASDQQIALDVALPHVRNEDMRLSLSDDDSNIHVKAWRALPARGRACLPESASVSRDGRYEILEANIAVPGIADGAKASMRPLRGGIRLLVPRRPRPIDVSSVYQSQTQTANVRGEKSSSGRGHADGQTSRDQPRVAASKTVGGDAKRYKKATHKYARSPVKVTLPPSTGIVVEDAAFPWPKKNADASEGWVDNRGDFQYY